MAEVQVTADCRRDAPTFCLLSSVRHTQAGVSGGGGGGLIFMSVRPSSGANSGYSFPLKLPVNV